MKSYFYPTEPVWFEGLLEYWKNSGKSTLGFPFFSFTPSTLPADKSEKFWMYLYFSKNKTEDPLLKQVVKFRVRVVAYDFSVIENASIHNRIDAQTDSRVWFQCDIVEEIRRIDGSYLMATDFKHSKPEVELLNSIHNSIAPVDCLASIATVQTTLRYIIN
jgi:hypothetical protein